MRKHNDLVDDLSSQTGQLLVSLFDFFVESLILNLQLFIVNQVQTLGKLLFFLQDFLLVSQSIPQSDVLKTVLMDLLILGLISVLPLLDNLGVKFFTSTAVDSVHCHTSLKLLELLLNLSAFCLLLVKLVLELTSHAIVSVLSLL